MPIPCSLLHMKYENRWTWLSKSVKRSTDSGLAFFAIQSNARNTNSREMRIESVLYIQGD